LNHILALGHIWARTDIKAYFWSYFRRVSLIAQKYILEFGDKYFRTDGEILFCKMGEVKVTADKRFMVQQHCNTVKHKTCVNRGITKESRQRLLFENSSSSSPKSGNASEFSKDLCTMMMLS
jgi:hypothetical protein